MLLLAGFNAAMAQITITASDMPVAGDTLRYSLMADATSIDLSQAGANVDWDFSWLTPDIQFVDTYKTAAQVNPVYALTISPSAYGYKVSDSLPGFSAFLPISIKNIYTFYSKKNNPSRYVAEGFAASISGFPTAAVYQDEDEIYFLPLAYGNEDTSSFKLNFSLASFGSLSQQGTRITQVDAWGTITTPYTSAPAPCIRVRSELDEIDSVTVAGIPIGLPRHTIEYKWLATGEHYPLLTISTSVVAGMEVATGARYRDVARGGVNVAQTENKLSVLSVYPNPATDVIHVAVPATWQAYTVNVYDVQGRLIITDKNTSAIDVHHLSGGNYLVQVLQAGNVGYASFAK